MTETVASITELAPETGAAPNDARERIVASAYDLFSKQAVGSVSVEAISLHAGVSKGTFYRHFKSKEPLVLAFLAERERLWTYGFVEPEARRRGLTPEARLLAIFDVFDEWFRRPDFEACSFINVLLELSAEHPAGKASIDYLANIRRVVQGLADEAGLRGRTTSRARGTS